MRFGEIIDANDSFPLRGRKTFHKRNDFVVQRDARPGKHKPDVGPRRPDQAHGANQCGHTLIQLEPAHIAHHWQTSELIQRSRIVAIEAQELGRFYSHPDRFRAHGAQLPHVISFVRRVSNDCVATCQHSLEKRCRAPRLFEMEERDAY